jgi:N-ethylmaleimide reductase
VSNPSILLSAFNEKGLNLKNKMVMAPMTRSRADQDHIPTDIMVTYYEQRADAGLIITEGVGPSPNGVGYPRIPGIYNQDQIAAWKPVTEAVHRKGGKIFMQLMHTGRVSHPDNMPKDSTILAPSAIAPESTKMYTDQNGNQPIPTPKAMSPQEIQSTIDEYVKAAENAIEAGFDGVELHGANGYLLEQFINPGTNQRTDNYGGSVENRARIVLEVARKTAAAIGKEKVGIRLSPNGAFNDIKPFEGQEATYTFLARELNKVGILYIHLVNHGSMGAPALPENIRDTIGEKFDGILILSGGYDQEQAEQDLEEELGDLIAFGRLFLANPDLPERFAQDAELNEPDLSTFYTPGEKGYTDYPVLEDQTV